MDLPVRRMVAAEFVSELLAKIFLGPRRPRIVGLAIRGNGRPYAPSRLLLCGRDELLLAHRRKHQMTALERTVVVRPRRERRGRANQSGDQRGFRQRQVLRRLPEQILRHRLHAVDAGAQINAVQVQLEDLRFRELRLEQQRDAGLFRLAAVRPYARQEQRACELLRERAAAFHAFARSNVPNNRAGKADRIDARMVVEAAIFDRDHRVLHERRNLRERHVVALLVQPEPRLSVGAVKNGIADAARQPMHRDGVPRQPPRGHAGEKDERANERDGDPVPATSRPKQLQDLSSLFSSAFAAFSEGVVEARRSSRRA